MIVTFIGHGYVGLVTAAVFADLGNEVYVVGHTPEKIENLKKGIIPIFEPGLTEMVKKNIESQRLFFSLDYSSVSSSDVVFIAVGTPPQKTGDAELETVYEVAKEVAKSLKSGYTVVVTKSTVPPGTNKKISRIIDENKPTDAEFDIASAPEFLREGTAINDTLNPDRVVIGTESDKAQKILVSLHDSLLKGSESGQGQLVTTNLETAELIKYASNSFLATKISFSNAIAKLSELCGADGLKVLEGIGLDRRVGKDFLSPGVGYGGSCFPKDVKALVSIAADHGYDFTLLDQVEGINSQAKRDVVRKARGMLGELHEKSVTLLGLAFKPNTDDMRDAPSIDIAALLRKEGARVKAYDPEALENAKKVIEDVEFSTDLYEAVKGADLVIIITEWNEFKEADLGKIKSLMKSPNIIDGRNIYNPQEVKDLGFTYIGVGR